MKRQDVNLINYVNFEMKDIHDLSDELYESMIDQQNEDVIAVCDAMIKRLRLIQQSHK